MGRWLAWFVAGCLYSTGAFAQNGAPLPAGDCLGCVWAGYQCARRELQQGRGACEALGTRNCYWEPSAAPAGRCRSLFDRACDFHCAGAKKRGARCWVRSFDDSAGLIDDQTPATLLKTLVAAGCRAPVLVETRHGILDFDRDFRTAKAARVLAEVSGAGGPAAVVVWESCADGTLKDSEYWFKELGKVGREVRAMRPLPKGRFVLNQGNSYMGDNSGGAPLALAFTESGVVVRLPACAAVTDQICARDGQFALCKGADGKPACRLCTPRPGGFGRWVARERGACPALHGEDGVVVE